MSSNDEYGSLRAVASDRGKPEIQPRMLITKSCVPHEKIHSSIGEKELKQNIKKPLLYTCMYVCIYLSEHFSVNA